MATKAKISPATKLKWRKFHPERYQTIKDNVISRTTILTAQVIGPCAIIDKQTKEKTIQRVEFKGIEVPSIDPYIAIHTTDTRDRQLIFILSHSHDQYLLALPRSGVENITITDEQILFTTSRDYSTHLETDNISQTDLDLLKLAIKHWLEHQT